MSKREIDICICTFQRPHIVETLKSLAAMNIDPDWSLRAIIADNDETSSSKESVEEAAKSLPFPLTYLHAPARNISIARNACLDESKALLVAFIDDDEIVEKNWLAEMLQRLDETNAHAVIGPVKAIYEENCPDWVKEGDYHSRAAVYVKDEIITGYTANVLFDQTSKPFKDRRFRLELGQTGGEDSTFLKAAYKDGAKIEYAENAMITEVIPHNRTTFKWLLNRRFREGQTHGMMLVEEQQNPIKSIALAAAKSAFSFIVAPFFILQKHRMNFWLFRGAMHAGVVSHLLGKATLIQYGHDEETNKAG